MTWFNMMSAVSVNVTVTCHSVINTTTGTKFIRKCCFGVGAYEAKLPNGLVMVTYLSTPEGMSQPHYMHESSITAEREDDDKGNRAIIAIVTQPRRSID